jgi:hypothetical protein
MALRLTDRTVRDLPAPAKGSRIHYDDTVRGFGLRVTAAGARAFVLNYRRRQDGVEKRFTIGAMPQWSVGAAREEAKRLKRAIDGGADPVGEQQGARAAATMADLCDRFLQDHVPRKRSSTQRDYRQQISVDIRPAFGRAKVSAVRSPTSTPGTERSARERQRTLTARWRCSPACSRSRSAGACDQTTHAAA